VASGVTDLGALTLTAAQKLGEVAVTGQRRYWFNVKERRPAGPLFLLAGTKYPTPFHDLGWAGVGYADKNRDIRKVIRRLYKHWQI
jgi:hypothetical protein